MKEPPIISLIPLLVTLIPSSFHSYPLLIS